MELVLMQDKVLRKAFGVRLKTLRKQKKWTQKELAAKLGVRTGLLNKYECGLHVPPLETLVEIAGLFTVTLDFLLTGGAEEPVALKNTRLLERFRKLEDFAADDQETVIKLVDAYIVKHQVENVLKPARRPTGTR